MDERVPADNKSCEPVASFCFTDDVANMCVLIHASLTFSFMSMGGDLGKSVAS